MSTPVQKPGNSKQDYGTPDDFWDAIGQRFGYPTIDLAAQEHNAKCRRFISPGDDSLSQNWLLRIGTSSKIGDERGWLNPPFANITPWSEKCWQESQNGARILLLVPASTGSNWFANWVWRKASILWLSPRLTFVGCKDPYPKDLLLASYDRSTPPGEDLWRWKP